MDYQVQVDFDVTELFLDEPVYVCGTNAQYFSYEVSADESGIFFQVTNITGGNVDVVARKGVPLPTLTNYDYGSFNPGTADEQIVVFTNSTPVALSEGTWYFGVINRDGIGSCYDVVMSDFTGPLPNIINLTLNVPYANTNFKASGTPDYYRYVVASNETGVEFRLYGLSGNVNLVARRGFPLPSLTDYQYGSFNPGTNEEEIIVFTNSSPVVLTPGDWYLAVYNASATDVVYTALVTDFTGAVPNIITLTNGIPYPNTNGSVGTVGYDYYRYVVSGNAVRAQFELDGPSTNMELVVQRGLPLPNLTTYNYFGSNTGTNDVMITLFNSSTPTSLTPGEWFLAAVNVLGVPLSYAIKASDWPAAGTNIVIGRPVVTTNEFCFSWGSLAGVRYVVEGKANLINTNWDTVYSVTATDTNTTFCLPLPSSYHFFRVGELLSVGTVGQSVSRVQITSISRGTNGVLLKWQAAAGQTFSVQWEPALAPASWSTFTNAVTSTSGQYLFLDDGSQTGGVAAMRFYRLVQ